MLSVLRNTGNQSAFIHTKDSWKKCQQFLFLNSWSAVPRARNTPSSLRCFSTYQFLWKRWWRQTFHSILQFLGSTTEVPLLLHSPNQLYTSRMAPAHTTPQGTGDGKGPSSSLCGNNGLCSFLTELFHFQRMEKQFLTSIPATSTPS